MIATLITLLGLPSFPSINHLPLPADAREFTFVVLGDNRPAGSGLPPTPVFAEILKEVGYIKPAFVLSSGDLVYGNEESLEQYKKECDQVSVLVNALKVPFFNAPGNHEVAGRQEFQAEYMRRFGQMYGSFEFGGCHFTAIGTDEAGQSGSLSADQRSWLEKDLDGSKPTYVYMHHPVFARKDNAEASATVASADDLHNLFKSRNVKAVFEGHDHVYNHQTHDGIEYVIAGGAGAPLDAAPEEGGFFHYVVVTVKDGKATMNVVPTQAIQITHDHAQVRVASYADCDLPLNDLTIDTPNRPTKVTGTLDKKGKLSDVPVAIQSIEKVGKAYRVHLQFTLTKHRQTILTVN